MKIIKYYDMYCAQFFPTIILLLLITMVHSSPIDETLLQNQSNNNVIIKQEPLFSSALKNTAIRGSGNDGDGNSNTSNNNSNNSSMMSLRQFVNRFLRALSLTLNTPSLSSSSSSSTPFHSSSLGSSTGKVERRQDSITGTSFRFPEEQSSVTQQLQRQQPQRQSKELPPYLHHYSSLSSRAALHDSNNNNNNDNGKNERKIIKMGTIERVARPSSSNFNQRVSTNFNIPSTFGASPSSSSSSGFIGSPQLVTAASSISNNARLNDTRAIKFGKPSTIQSQPLYVTDGPRDGKRGRSLKTINVQGVKIIVGERVPDDPEDKFFTWRNARVIKGVLVPKNENDNNPTNSNEDFNINNKNSNKDGGRSYSRLVS